MQPPCGAGSCMRVPDTQEPHRRTTRRRVSDSRAPFTATFNNLPHSPSYSFCSLLGNLLPPRWLQVRVGGKRACQRIHILLSLTLFPLSSMTKVLPPLAMLNTLCISQVL